MVGYVDVAATVVVVVVVVVVLTDFDLHPSSTLTTNDQVSDVRGHSLTTCNAALTATPQYQVRLEKSKIGCHIPVAIWAFPQFQIRIF